MASWTTGHPHCDAETVPKRPCALLWDESFFWGVMAWRALPESLDPSCLQENLEEIRGLLLPFCEKAKRLLVGERFYMMSAPLSPVGCEDVEISRLRQELFASAMSHGGGFQASHRQSGPFAVQPDPGGMNLLPFLVPIAHPCNGCKARCPCKIFLP